MEKRKDGTTDGRNDERKDGRRDGKTDRREELKKNYVQTEDGKFKNLKRLTWLYLSL
jgi:Asp-tRNA(Asn)/Glu-tRNA(Gln) amidotransferase C subunit